MRDAALCVAEGTFEIDVNIRHHRIQRYTELCAPLKRSAGSLGCVRVFERGMRGRGV